MNIVNTYLKKVTFLGACKAYFGSKPGQSLKEFAEEMQGLTQADIDELVAMFPSVGLDPTVPSPIMGLTSGIHHD